MNLLDMYRTTLFQQTESYILIFVCNVNEFWHSGQNPEIKF